MEHDICCGTRKFFTQGLWIEGEAEAQLDRASKLPGAIGCFAMPDLHPGKGIPIGAAVATEGLFYPHLAGNDIGCGVLCVSLDGLAKASPDKLAKIKWLKGDPEEELWEAHAQRHAQLWDSMGWDWKRNRRTIGGGNHFLEICLVEESMSDGAPQKGSFVALAHSGSRHLGEAAARIWTDANQAKPALESDPAAQSWLSLHDACADWARSNRMALAEHAALMLGCEAIPICDSFHNSIRKLDQAQMERCGLVSEKGVYLHRKGASEADGGFAALPGSRGDFSYLLSIAESSKSALSLAHGAGRKWRRSDCHGRLERFRASDLEKTKLGSRVVCEDKELLFEEAPQAYKDSASVLKALEEHGLATAAAKLRPLLTLKI